MDDRVSWYQHTATHIASACVLALLVVVWIWRAWIGMNLNGRVQIDTTEAFDMALRSSSAELTSLQKVYSGNRTFYLPDYLNGRNVQSLESLFVYNLNQMSSMPMFRVESIQLLPTTTMQFLVRIRYATWLGMSKTLTVSGNPPIPHKQ